MIGIMLETFVCKARALELASVPLGSKVMVAGTCETGDGVWVFVPLAGALSDLVLVVLVKVFPGVGLVEVVCGPIGLMFVVLAGLVPDEVRVDEARVVKLEGNGGLELVRLPPRPPPVPETPVEIPMLVWIFEGLDKSFEV